MNIQNIKNYNTTYKKKEKRHTNTTQRQNCEINLSNNPNAIYGKIQVNFTSKLNLNKCEKYSLNNYQGCILGGAIGDAFGAPVEFMNTDAIKIFYGTNGIKELECNDFGIAEFTDDTQMTIFTADGILKSLANKTKIDELPDFDIIYQSYLNWLDTQKGCKKVNLNDWILNIDELYSERAPGITCTYALQNKIPGNIEIPINQSDGCGGLMRSAPIGLIYYEDDELAFEIGAKSAALTHGSPEGYLPAGVLASIISNLIQGKNLNNSINNAIKILKKYEHNEITLEFLQKAISLAQTNIEPQEAIPLLGEGWGGHEALSIAIYSVLKSPENYQKAIQIATNHDGDSDSTAAITGNIIGTFLGLNNIPKTWIESVEINEKIQELSTDLYQACKNPELLKGKYHLSK